MAAPKVFIFAPADKTGASHKRLEEAGCRLSLGAKTWHAPGGDNEAAMAEMAAGAAALTGTSIRSSPITRRLMEAAGKDLRIIAKCTIGVDDIDIEGATELGILVTHAPTESNWGGVAEGTMAMMLTMLKKNREKDRSMRQGEWQDPSLMGTHLGRRQDGWPGITVGIIGLGRIGSRFADLLAPWRVRLLGYDPYVDQAKYIHHNVERVDLETLLRESDVVSVHVVLTAETRKMMGEAQFSLMRPSAILINTARGKCVDEDALFDAVAKGDIGGAALDAFDDEPLDPQSPLFGLGDKVLLSPHMVSANVGSGIGPGIEWATASVLAALRGEVPDNVYNKDVAKAWRERFGGTSAF